MSKTPIPKPTNFDRVDPSKASKIVTSNKYELSGGNVKVTYGTSGADGKPYLNYTDATMSKVFVGDQIRVIQETDLGTLVSVSIRITVDSGSTSFTIFIPRVKMPDAQGSAHITTVGITTLHRISIVPVFSMGQTDCYTVVMLTGTASVETCIHTNP